MNKPDPHQPDLARMRHDYSTAGLSRAELSDDPFDQFAGWLAAAVEAGVTEPNAMVVSSVDGDGQPWGRFVLLKGVTAGGFEFYTNYGSFKSQQLAAGGRAALTFGWLDLHRQVNVAGSVVRVSAAESDEYWAVRPRGSQLGGWASLQSTPIPDRSALDDRYREAEARFADADTIPRPEYWGGWRVVPHTIEFWQGRSSRLHDRFRYTRSDPGEAWSVTRLMP